jgi:carbamoyltransferase
VRVLGINAVFHDPAAALVVDGSVVAAAEEERFSRRKHGKRPVPFSAWELPEAAAAWCLRRGGLEPGDVDVVAYSFDVSRARDAADVGLHDPWDHLRRVYAAAAPGFMAEALGVDPARVVRVPHHVSHAASAGLATPYGDGSVLTLDGRGEATSHLAGRYTAGELEILAEQSLPHSLGLFYEDLTEHLGFHRSSDEYKVMAMASSGTPRFAGEIRRSVHATGDGGFRTSSEYGPVDWEAFVPRAHPGAWEQAHHDLAASAQLVLEEVILDLARWLHGRTGDDALAMAGGVALNCVANSRLASEGPFRRIWVQPAAGDAGTALGAALQVAWGAGDGGKAMTTAALGREVTDADAAAAIAAAGLPLVRPEDLVGTVAEVLAGDGVVAWVQGAAEFGPRALGHRSLLAHPGKAANLDRLNAVKGRESFRPVAPMIRTDRAADVVVGPLPSPYMLFVHDVRPQWRDRIPAVVHVDGTARVQTVDPVDEPLVAELLRRFEDLTGLPALVNTSLNTAGRPMVDTARDALELFGSAPVDLLVLGPYVLRRRDLTAPPEAAA